MPSTFEDRNWTEDFSHENGNYLCKCRTCGLEFLGHKRRVTCKKCHVDSARLYSSNPAEEARMIKVRDAHPRRVEAIAKCRCDDKLLPFHDIELQWINERDDRDRYPTYPLMEPNEYWPLIASLAFQLRQARLDMRDLAKR